MVVSSDEPSKISKLWTPKIKQSILGDYIVDTHVIEKVLKFFGKNKPLYKRTLCQLYQTLKEMYSQEESIDLHTLNELSEKGNKLFQIGLDYYLVHLIQNIVSCHI
ncbi:MAG: DnaB-like helicase N-terminal domain-containing protein [Flavobacteriales bacterium AspAUS03]